MINSDITCIWSASGILKNWTPVLVAVVPYSPTYLKFFQGNEVQNVSKYSGTG